MTEVKIAVAGIGYVGLSMAVLLAQHNQVTAVDIDETRVQMLNGGKSPIIDPDVEAFLARGLPHLSATTNAEDRLPGRGFRDRGDTHQL